LELGRRHKIRNPEKMRSAYAKLIYLLQDSVNQEVQDLLEFSCAIPVRTVHTLLSSSDNLALLDDPLLPVATQQIITDGKSRWDIDAEVKRKNKAFNTLCKRNTTSTCSYEMCRLAVLSIGDNHNYLFFNRDPCTAMITYLTKLFNPDSFTQPYCLSINDGADGSRLTHSHHQQYHFVLQSLTLWRDIEHDMFKLWCLAEDDLLDSSNAYQLKQTGQGLHRVQQAPRISKAMRMILSKAQKKLGTWIGSSVIHLGDTNVPNALMFIDKYNQVGRILNPIIICLRQLKSLSEKEDTEAYIKKTWGSYKDLRLAILTDFFKSAFDGSGSDSFFEAGSCIDGRLTSAWNWCSKLSEKPFYPVFLLTGFVGFDGKF